MIVEHTRSLHRSTEDRLIALERRQAPPQLDFCEGVRRSQRSDVTGVMPIAPV
jgi:hypothetical protein